jgi:hypothetical protein
MEEEEEIRSANMSQVIKIIKMDVIEIEKITTETAAVEVEAGRGVDEDVRAEITIDTDVAMVLLLLEVLKKAVVSIEARAVMVMMIIQIVNEIASVNTTINMIIILVVVVNDRITTIQTREITVSEQLRRQHLHHHHHL